MPFRPLKFLFCLCVRKRIEALQNVLLVCFIRVFLFRLRIGVDQKEAAVVGKITRNGVIQHLKGAVRAQRPEAP